MKKRKREQEKRKKERKRKQIQKNKTNLLDPLLGLSVVLLELLDNVRADIAVALLVMERTTKKNHTKISVV